MFSIKETQEYEGFDTWGTHYTLLDSDGTEIYSFGWDKPRAYKVLEGLNSGAISIDEILAEKASNYLTFNRDGAKIHRISLNHLHQDDIYPQDFTIEIDGKKIYPSDDADSA